MVTIVTNPEDKRTDKEDHGGEGIGEVKTNKLKVTIGKDKISINKPSQSRSCLFDQ